MSKANKIDLKAVSENQFYNDLSALELERLQCSQSKAKSLQKNENLSQLTKQINEIAPQLKKLRKDIAGLISKNQILNGQIPKGTALKPGSVEFQRKADYDDRNQEIKSLMAIEELLISQIPFSETSPIRNLLDQAISHPLSENDALMSLQKLDISFENSKTKLQKTKINSNFELSTDQKISMGTDDFLIAQMIHKNPNNEIQIKNLQCSAEKIKNGKNLVTTAGTVASFVLPTGLASAGRLAFLMRAPLMAQKFSQLSRVAGSASLLVGNIHGLENVFNECTKTTSAKVQSANGSGTQGQCDYSSQTLVADFSSSSCILNATLQLLPNAGAFFAKKIADRNSLLSKYISDIQNTPSLKKLTTEEKEVFLNTARTMSNPQRKASAGILAERSLSPAEKNGLIEAHLIAKGKDYFQLSPAELKLKLEKLTESGFSKPESDLILRSGLAGGQVAKAYKTTGQTSLADIVNDMDASGNKLRLQAELKLTAAKPDVAGATADFKKSTNSYLQEMKDRGGIASERELSDIEYVAARWASQTKDPKEIAEATKAYTEAIDKRFVTSGKGNGENVQQYLQQLQSDPGKGLHREASEWQRKTIIQYLNSKGWNLR